VRIDDEARRIRVILLDIEGTTTPIDFVTKTLFPYASERLSVFLHAHGREPETLALMCDLQAQHERDETAGLLPPPWRENSAEDRLASGSAYLEWLVARDSKCTPLKSLQGKIWQEGYVRGELHGEVYDDVPRAMERWREQGRQIAIYSSGSVLAQRLLLQSTGYGDLTRHIRAFFDTRTGPKTAADSYTEIAAALQHAATDMLFVSDAPKEIEAAHSIGMRTALCIRQPQTDLAPGKAIFTFDEVFPN